MDIFDENTDLCEAVPAKSSSAACFTVSDFAVFSLAWEKTTADFIIKFQNLSQNTSLLTAF